MPEKLPDKISPQTEKLSSAGQYNFFSAGNRQELISILETLPPAIKGKIASPANQSETNKIIRKVVPEGLAARLTEENRRWRADHYLWKRDDVAELDQISVELALNTGLNNAINGQIYAPSEYSLIRANSAWEFSKFLSPFLDSVWRQRGAEKIAHDDDQELQSLEENLAGKKQELGLAEQAWQKKSQALGRRRRLTEREQEEFKQISDKIFELSGKIYSRDQGVRSDGQGQFSSTLAIEQSKIALIRYKHEPYAALIYLMERFSAEESAVVVYECLYTKLNQLSRNYPSVNPELLDYLEKTCQEWSQRHQGEKALIVKENDINDQVEIGKKLQRLIEQLVERLASYQRNKDESTQDQQNCSEFEILVAARLIKRQAEGN